MPPLPRIDPPLTDGQVLLREWTDEDVDAMVAALADPGAPRRGLAGDQGLGHPLGRLELRPVPDVGERRE